MKRAIPYIVMAMVALLILLLMVLSDEVPVNLQGGLL